MDMVLGTQVPSDPLSTDNVVIHVVYKTKLAEITQQENDPLKSAYCQPTFICHYFISRFTKDKLLHGYFFLLSRFRLSEKEVTKDYTKEVTTYKVTVSSQ